MPKGQTIPGVVPISTAVNLKPELELLLMGTIGPLEGKLVRVTVYDEVLFRHGPFKQRYDAVFSVFNGFTEAQTVPEDFRFPNTKIGDGENGILLTFILPVIKEVPKTAGVQKRWAFGEPTEVTEVRPRQIMAEIDLIMRNEDNDRQVRGTIRMPFSTLKGKRTLVIVVQNQADHSIVFSTGWRKIDGGAQHFKKNANGLPPSVTVAAKDAGLEPKVGGTGLGPGAPEIQAAPPPLVDFTGIFEAFTDQGARPGDDMPAMIIELNQAGNALAGWINPVRRDVPGNPGFIGAGIPASKMRVPPPPDLSPLRNDGFALMLAHLNGNRMPFKWGFSGQFDDPEAKFVDDGVGELTGLGDHDLRAEFTRNGETRALFLRRVEPTPRWSNATLDAVIEQNSGESRLLKRLYRGSQVQPLPVRLFNLLALDMANGGTLAFLITRQQQNANPIRLQARTDISNYLESLIRADEYRELIIAYFTHMAATLELTIDIPVFTNPLPGKGLPAGPATKTIYDWLQFIVEEQLSPLLLPTGSLTPGQAITRVDPGFREFGFCPEGGFLYRFDFDPLGAEVPVGKAVKVGAYAFDVTIKKFALNDDGSLGAQDLTRGWTAAGKKMFGFYGDIGAALEANFKRGSQSNFAQTAEFASFHDLAPADITTGNFYTITAGGPGLTFGAARFLRGPNSAIIVMTLHKDGLDGSLLNAVRMVGSINNVIQSPDINPQIIGKKKEWKLKLATLSMGWGAFGETESSDIPPVKKEDTPSKNRTGKSARVTDAYFRRGGSNLAGESLASFHEFLAVERALFVSGGGFASAEGHCSPEGPDNQGLSERRALHVTEAIEKAFGKRLAIKMESFGSSDRLALLSGMLPPSALNDPAKRDEYRKQEASEFKEFRLVQLLVEGTIFLEIRVEKVGIADAVVP